MFKNSLVSLHELSSSFVRLLLIRLVPPTQKGKKGGTEENSFHGPWQQSAIMWNETFYCCIKRSANIPSMVICKVKAHHCCEHYYSIERKTCRTQELPNNIRIKKKNKPTIIHKAKNNEITKNLPLKPKKPTKELQYLVTFKILLQGSKKMKTACRLVIKENVNNPSESLIEYRSIQSYIEYCTHSCINQE